ncbi:MAG: hypothetical protein ACYTFH_08635 [Planctomycetota bacterium]|jgi:hypothetical protein
MTHHRSHLRSAALVATLIVLAFGSVDESSEEMGVELPTSPSGTLQSPPARVEATPTDLADGVRRDLPDVLDVLSGDALTDDQKQALFERDLENEWFAVEGVVTDVGTWLGEKYVTIRVRPGNLCDVYLDDDFDLLAYRVGERVSFSGRFTLRGTGNLIHRGFEDGRDLDGPRSSEPNRSGASARDREDVLSMQEVCRVLRRDGRSADQRAIIFEREFQNRRVLVEGRVTDVGTFLGEKYVTVNIEGQDIDIIPSEDFDLLSLRKGEVVAFEGPFTFFDATLNFHARVEPAVRR